MLFWVFAFLIVAAAAAFATRPLWSGRQAAPSRAAHDVQVYKSQLREIDRDLARGVLDAAEAEGARREIGRKLLAAAEEAERDGGSAPAPEKSARLGVAAAAAVVAVGSLGVYLGLGAPGAPDRPLTARNFLAERLDTRLSQADAEAGAAELPRPPVAQPEAEPGAPDFETLVARMREVLKERPDDVQGRLILARAFMQADRAPEAWPLFAEARRLLGENATPELGLEQAEAMVFAAGGYVSREAEMLLRETPADPRARYFIYLAYAQSGDLRRAAAGWGQLLQDFPDAPFAAALRGQIARAGQEGQFDVSALLGGAPAGGSIGGPGPSEEEMAAASEMTEEERAEMIGGMVARLAERLDENPRDIEGWVRLIRAYGVLGRTEDAQTAYDRARVVFEDDTPNLQNLAVAAALAGLDP